MEPGQFHLLLSGKGLVFDDVSVFDVFYLLLLAQELSFLYRLPKIALFET